MSLVEYELQLEAPGRYRLQTDRPGSVAPRVFGSEQLVETFEHDALKQLNDASQFEDVRFVGGMPDLHVGYGLPVGGAFVVEPDSIISAGAIGMDINCGMRMLRIDRQADDINAGDLKALTRRIGQHVPLGIGTQSPHSKTLTSHITDVLCNGVSALKAVDMVTENDIEHLEENGSMDRANPDALSDRARDRTDQLGTLGGGNHFIEVQAVETIHDQKRAEAYGLQEGQLAVMIHTGSRGLGAQICQDFSGQMAEKASEHSIELPTKGLAAAPMDSELGRQYLGAMRCAVNFAFANRQVIAHDIRRIVSDYLQAETRTVYDIAHNIGKSEARPDGDSYFIHRKGATRALPPGHELNPSAYESVGAPAIVPGNMGAPSYVLAAGERVGESYLTINHGAGRTMSRSDAEDRFTVDDMKNDTRGVFLYRGARSDILDETPGAYKDISTIIDSVMEAGLARPVAQLRPIGNIKGD